MTSAITDTLSVDPPIVQDSSFRRDEGDRRYIDDQILGVQKHLVKSLIRGAHCTYAYVANSSAALNAGDVVCTTTSVGELTVTKATPAALLVSRSAFGVATGAGVPGTRGNFAISGAIPPSVTGLAAAAGYARVSTTGRLELVTVALASDVIVGTVDSTGWLTIGAPRAPRVSKTLLTRLDTQSATGADILTFPIAAGETWAFKFRFTGSCSSTGGTKYRIYAPLNIGATLDAWLKSSTTNITTALSFQRLAINTLNTTAVHTATGGNVLGPDTIEGSIFCQSDDVVSFQTAAVTSASQHSYVEAGADLDVWPARAT